MSKETDAGLEVGELCGMLGKSRQAYYEGKRRRERDTRKTDAEIVLHHVRERRDDLPKEGCRKLYHALKPILVREGVKMGRDKLFETLKLNGMLQKRKRTFSAPKNGQSRLQASPNLIKDAPEVAKPNRVWASDMTYLKCGNSFLFLSLVTDHYNHEIVGYALSKDLKTDGPKKALRKALEGLGEESRELVHHSDRGIQYRSETYTSILKDNGIGISMTRGGEPTANPIAERVNGILKHELGLDARFPDFEAAEVSVERAIYLYNNKRPHASIDYLTPVMARNHSGAFKKRWKPVKREQKTV